MRGVERGRRDSYDLFSCTMSPTISLVGVSGSTDRATLLACNSCIHIFVLLHFFCFCLPFFVFFSFYLFDHLKRYNAVRDTGANSIYSLSVYPLPAISLSLPSPLSPLPSPLSPLPSPLSPLPSPLSPLPSLSSNI